MRRTPSSRELVGRTITGFHSGAWVETRPDGSRVTRHAPVVTLDDGSQLRMTVAETESGEYSVLLTRHRKEA